MKFYLYILFSNSLDSYYVGFSSDPWNRETQHNTNSSEKYTGRATDWELAAVFLVGENRGEAMRIEKFIKKQKSKAFLLKLIDPDFVPKGILAQLLRVPIKKFRTRISPHYFTSTFLSITNLSFEWST